MFECFSRKTFQALGIYIHQSDIDKSVCRFSTELFVAYKSLRRQMLLFRRQVVIGEINDERSPE